MVKLKGNYNLVSKIFNLPYSIKSILFFKNENLIIIRFFKGIKKYYTLKEFNNRGLNIKEGKIESE